MAHNEDTTDADLSLSELSLNDRSIAGPSQPFSLLARPSQPPEPDIENDGAEATEGINIAGDEAEVLEDPEAERRSVARTREERLRQDLFVLRKLNSGFSIYNDALTDTQSSTERVADQLKRTNTLLDKYVNILTKSEEATQLIFDERWHGAEEDEALLLRQQREAEEKLRREEAARLEAERKAQERRERDERERLEAEAREQAEAERREKLAIRAGYGGVRGVRGTRASARARGVAVARGALASATRGRVSSIPTPANTSGGRSSRPTSSASVRSTASALSSRPGIR